MHLTEISNFPSFSPFRSANKQSSVDLVFQSFDEAILRRLKTLHPPSVSLSWLSLAVDFLCFVHTEAKLLISNLKISSLEDTMDWFLDQSLKILDLCNSITLYIERLRQKRLRLDFACHLLGTKESGEDRPVPPPETLRRARDSFSDWRICSLELKARGFRGEIEVLIRDLAVGLQKAPRGKTSTVGRTIRRTINAVGFVTVFVAEAVVRSLYGSSKLVAIRVPAEYSWAESFNRLESEISADQTQRFSGKNDRYVVEMNEVETRIRCVCNVIDNFGEEPVGRLTEAVSELRKSTETYSEGLERLGDGINGMFRTILSSRNVMLDNLRVGPEIQKQAHK